MTGNSKHLRHMCSITSVSVLSLLVVFVTELAVLELFAPVFSGLGQVTASLLDAVILVLLYAVPLWYLVVKPLFGGNSADGTGPRFSSLVMFISALTVIFLVDFLVMLYVSAFLPGADDKTRNLVSASACILFCFLPLWCLFRQELRNCRTLLADSLGTPLKLYFFLLAMVFLFDLLESQLIPSNFPAAGLYSHKIFDAFLITLLTAPFLWMLMVRPLKRIALLEKTRSDALQSQVIDAIMVIDEQGVIESFNPAAEGIFGFPANEIIGKSASILLCGNQQCLDDMLRQSNAYKSWAVSQMSHEVFGCRSDGSKFTMDVSISRILLNDRLTFLMIMRDISVRKKMELALRDSEKRFRDIFEQTEDAIIFFKPGSCSIIDINSAAENLYGYGKTELQAGGLELICTPENFAVLSRCIGEITHGKISSLDNICTLRKDGTEIFVSMRGKLMTLQNVEIIYCSFRDVTKRILLEEEAREMQAKLIQANKMASLGLLVSGVAHEINNPNNFIQANARLLSRSWEDILKILREYYRENGDFTVGGIHFEELDANSPQLFAGIIDGSQRINEIISNLKSLARQERLMAEQDVDINQVATSAVSILYHEIIKYTENFHFDLAREVPHVKGSRQQLGQVIINLLMNACQALPARRCGISLSTGFDAASDMVTITITDEGCGISRSVGNKIMEPFFTTKLDDGGTGLGLSISQSIIKDHNGFLEFKSEPGEGTTFIVKIPRLKTSTKEQLNWSN
jgi:PAS domain S-box-containing protein